MPTGPAARRQALLEDLRQRVGIAICAARLLHSSDLSPRERQLIARLEEQLADLETLFRNLVDVS